MGMGGSMPSFDPIKQEEITSARLERERLYRRQEAEDARMARMEEEKLRMSLERAFREEEQERLADIQEDIEQRETQAVQESAAQTQQSSSVSAMGRFFADRPSISIPARSE